MVEDRVVTTELLRRMHAGIEGELLVPAGLVEVLDPAGLHVLVPNGHTHGEGGQKIVCAAQLAVEGTDDPTVVDVVVSVEHFEALPATFHVLRTATALIPAAAAEVDEELAELSAGEGGSE